MSDRGVMFQYFEWNLRPDGSLWRELASRAAYLKRLGVTAVWMPPAQKTMDGGTGVGYPSDSMHGMVSSTIHA